MGKANFYGASHELRLNHWLVCLYTNSVPWGKVILFQSFPSLNYSWLKRRLGSLAKVNKPFCGARRFPHGQLIALLVPPEYKKLRCWT